MTQYLNNADLITIGLYLLSLVVVGIYLQRRASNSLEDYIVGGKKLPFWALGTSGTAQYLDLSGTAVVVSFLYLVGPQGFFVNFRGHVILAMVIVMLWSGKYHRRSGCLTAAEWNLFRFGDGASGRFAQIAMVVSAVLITMGSLAYLMVGAGVFLSTFVPFSPDQCALALVVVATLYTVLSGFYGVVVTDVIQSVIVIFAALLVSVLAFNHIESFEALAATASSVTGYDTWSQAAPVWHADLPAGYEDYEYVSLFAVFFMLRAFLVGLGMGNESRYMGARSDKDTVALSFITTSLTSIRWPMMMGFAVLGLFAVQNFYPDQDVISSGVEIVRQAYPDVTEDKWGALVSDIGNNPENYSPALIESLKNALGENGDWNLKLQLLGYHGTVNPEKILPTVLATMIPAGFRGLLIVALVAAAMSTFDSQANWAAGLLSKDVYQKYFRKKAGSKELVLSSYCATVLIVLVSFVFTFGMTSINDVYKWIIVSLQSGLMVPTILKFYWWRFNGAGFAGGVLTGAVAAIVQRLYFPDLPEMTLLLYSMSLGGLGSVIGTYMTGPTEEKVLSRFYNKTLPMGAWKTYKEKLTPEVRARAESEHKRDIMAVPFAALWQITLFFAPLLLVIHHFQGFIVSSITSAVCFFIGYKFWYKKLPPPMEDEK
ncbi:sodium:solute symporter family transporter [Pelagicoccus mobilis]|uniref:Sodium:solute symporter n=1 Tax=Pelagicoccus mobilis TaxID=415221 RepID=A0A934S391_9BACT|nr:hypothetical protein [Pelagicoccus mobilis]MBK1879856.1 hypothetical protein [Pelagicoccus mobilis]